MERTMPNVYRQRLSKRKATTSSLHSHAPSKQLHRKAEIWKKKVADFIVLDDQQLSVVDKVGFWCLTEHLEPRYMLPNQNFISRTAIPNKYKQACTFISKCLANVAMANFTNDIWSLDLESNGITKSQSTVDSWKFYFAEGHVASSLMSHTKQYLPLEQQEKC